MAHEIFKTNPNLEKVHVTSDNTAFYQENDAKNHAKTLEDKLVETVYNPKMLFVEYSEELTSEDLEMAEFEAAEKKAAACRLLLAEFDPETTKYQEALKLFKVLELESENEKKETIYPLLIAAKASAQEGVNTEE